MTNFLRLRYPLNILIIIIILTSTTYSEIIDGIAAIVNDELITISEVNNEMKPFLAKIESSNLTQKDKDKQIEEMREKVITTLINNKLIELKAKELNFGVDDNELKNVIQNILKEQHITIEQLKEALKENNISFEAYKERIRGEVLRARVVNSFVKSQIKIPKSDIDKYVSENFKEKQELRYHIKQIFIKGDNRDQLNDVNTTIKNESFESAYTKYSGSDLGWFKKGEMLPDIENIVIQMKVNDIREVKTAHGYHIIKLEAKDENSRLKEKLEKEAENTLKSKIMKEKLENWINELKEKAVIIRKM